MSTRTLIIAEAGVNHNGDLLLAKDLIASAAIAGADIVKFQSFVSTKLLSPFAPKADYQRATTDPSESQFEMVKKLELTKEDHLTLIETCRQYGIQFLSTAFDTESFDMLVELGITLVKIPSGEITNLPFLRYVAGVGLPIILSTGMATLGEIESALDAIEEAGTPRDRVTILHCSTEYPTPMADVNLRAMCSIGHAFRVKVGYSDHTVGLEVPVAAVAMGATVIEKHFTMDRNLPGPDHKASLEPQELKDMVQAIRNIELALGDGIKRPNQSELKNRDIARKSLVATHAIRAGERFTAKNLSAKRPGNGITPMRWDEVLGRTAHRDFAPDEMIDL